VLENQRRRLMDAVAAISREKGYAGLTVSGIARRARVSHKTFYEHFSDRHEAFLSTVEYGCAEVFDVSAQAYGAREHDWPRAVRAGLYKLLDWLAARPPQAHLAWARARKSPTQSGPCTGEAPGNPSARRANQRRQPGGPLGSVQIERARTRPRQE
jgi:AcrR family transcriptional regulator